MDDRGPQGECLLLMVLMPHSMCFISQVPLFVSYDSGATHLFISWVCVEKLFLHVSSLRFDLIMDHLLVGLF